MNLNSVEWARAQDLLLKLVQALSPFVSREPNTSQAMSLTLSRRFFSPPTGELPRFRYAARLLTTLADAKKEVDDWIGKLPETEAEFGKTPTSEAGQAKKGMTGPFLGKGASKEASDISAQNSAKNRGGDASSSSSASKASQSGAFLQTGGSALTSAAKDAAALPMKTPVTSQAQQVIDQVRQAILTLSSSAYLIDPKAGPLRDALKRLKPFIDQLIEAVSQEGMHSSGDGLQHLFKFQSSSSEREALLKKMIQFPQSVDKKNSRRSFADSTVVKETKSNLNLPGNKGSADRAQSNPQKDSPKDTQTDTLASIAETRETSISTPSGNSSSPPFQGEGAGLNQPYAPERTTIPGAPYTPLTELNSSSRKGKKKRRGLWLSDEEDLEEKERDKR